jgi:DNA-binding NarL/FixJ family response regulator
MRCPNGAPPCRVLLVEDHPLLREAVADLIAHEPGLAVCGQAGDVTTGFRLARTAHPDVALLDITLPDGNGIDLTRRIHQFDWQVRVIVLSVYEARLQIERSLRAGAVGYVSKDEPADAIVDAIRRALDGRMRWGEVRLEPMLKKIEKEQSVDMDERLDALNDLERGVLCGFGRDEPIQRTAERLGIPPGIVPQVRHIVSRKLNVDTDIELLTAARRLLDRP